MKKIILASRSPRRDEILSYAGLRHEILVSEADETLPEGVSPAEAVKELSLRKAKAVSEKLKDTDFVIIAADTMVEKDGVMLGKPGDFREAEKMLRSLSGTTHFVHTGVTLTDGEKTVCETVTTEVTMRTLSDKEIKGYVESGEPMDKAGAYGIQGVGGVFITSIKGDYFNVVGLPICRVCELLKEFGIELFENPI